jgi:hypothetical protein
MVRVKPFLFILELLNHPDVGWLSKEEMAVPLVYGHRPACRDLCIEKILQLRAGARFEDIIEDDNDLYTPRHQKFPEGLVDDANTFKNYLQSCCLVYEEQQDGRKVVKFDEDARAVYQEHLALREVFIEYDNDESFQRRYGALTERGDTRQLTDQSRPRLSPATSMILSQFYALCGENIISDLPQTFIDALRHGYGFSLQQIQDAVGPHLATALNYFESTYIELSRSGNPSEATRFEKATEAIFRDRLDFVTRHTGQQRRVGLGGYADIFLVALDQHHCAIVDAKASPRYALSHEDILKMASTYIPSYRELCGSRNLTLEFAAYVAGGYAGRIEDGLQEITRRAGTPCSAITARGLLGLAKEGSPDQVAVRARFATTGLVA